MSSSNDWSIAILVKSKLSTLYVSSALRQKPWQLPAISHEVLIDPSGPSLAASVIASMLEPVKDQEDCLLKLLNSTLLHFQGRKGDKISQSDLKFADAISSFIRTGKLNGKNRQLFVDESRDLVEKIFQLRLVGIPQEDWLTVRKLF